jgi:hypothetical protein
MLLPFDFAVLLIITVANTMDTIDIRIAVRNINCMIVMQEMNQQFPLWLFDTFA